MTESRTPSASRRTFLKGIGGVAASGVGLASMSSPAAAFDWDDAKTVGAYAAAGPVGLAWAIYEYQPFAEDAPPSGLSGSALTEDVYQTARTRRSTNGSTIVDNQNILSGTENVAYTQGKIAAIEAINNGETQSAVQSAANDAVDAHATTVKKNLLKTWNEACREFDSYMATVQSHSDVGLIDVLPKGDYPTGASNESWVGFDSAQSSTRTISLPDGSDFTLVGWNVKWIVDNDSTGENDILTLTVDPLMENTTHDGQTTDDLSIVTGAGRVDYLSFQTWNGIWTEMGTVFQGVRDGLTTWVDSVYGSVQSGDIAVKDLITPSERASMLAEDGAEAKAIADLVALNVPVDVEREATVRIAETGAKLRGMLGLSDSSDGPIEAATTYDASTFSGDVYLTFDMSEAQGNWSAYQTAVDGGVVTLTEQPHDGLQYRVQTTAGETGTVNSSNWSPTGNGTWTHDLSDQLENPITEVKSVDYLSQSDTTNYQTTKITGTFTVESLVNTETGEEADSATFESTQPQDDSNYITQSEWDSLVERNKELINEFKAAQEEADSGGTSGGGDSGGLGAQLKDWAQNRPAEAAGSVLAIGGLGYLYTQEGE